jgi:hypothetical protein
MQCELDPCKDAAVARLTFGSERQPAKTTSLCQRHLDDFNDRFRGQIQQNIVWISLAAPERKGAA